MALPMAKSAALLALGAIVHAQGTCNSHDDCRSGDYCDVYNNCYTCDFITSAVCDALPVAGNTGSDCCSSPFLLQCPTDPAECSSGGSESGDTSGGTGSTGSAGFSIGTTGRGGCPTTDWEYATDTAHRGMRSCADLRDQGECWTLVRDLVGYTVDDQYSDVSEYCPCCYDSDSSTLFAAYGSEPGTVRARANSVAGGSFYDECYADYVEEWGHVDSCFVCIEYGAPGTGELYSSAESAAICPEYTQDSERWCELETGRPTGWFNVNDEAECSAEPCCHWTRDRATGGQCWSSLGTDECKAENIWDMDESDDVFTGAGYCPDDPDRTFEGSLFVQDLPRVPNPTDTAGDIVPTGHEFYFSCKWFNDQPVWRACLVGLGDDGISDQDPGKEGEHCPGGVLSIFFNSAGGVWVLHNSLEDTDFTIGNDFEGVITHQTQPHVQVNELNAPAPRSCDAPWECMWRKTGPRGEKVNLRACAGWMTVTVSNGELHQCGTDDWESEDWGNTGSDYADDYSLLEAVDECGSAPCNPSGTSGCVDDIAEYTCDCNTGWQGNTCEEYDFYAECHSRVAQPGGSNGAIKCAEATDEDTCNQMTGYGGCWWEANVADTTNTANCRSVVGNRDVYTTWFCDCLESVDAARYFGEDPSFLRSWFSDGYCDEIFNTPECRFDDEPGDAVTVDWDADGTPDVGKSYDEDCAGQRSICTTSAPHDVTDTPMNRMLEACFPGGNNNAADGTIEPCGTVTAGECQEPMRLPRHCSEQCARVFLDWYAGCGHDNTHPLFPMWVWDGFADICKVALAPEAIRCENATGARVGSVPAWQQCDGFCDCPEFCEDEGFDARAMLPDSDGHLFTCREAYIQLDFNSGMSCPTAADMKNGIEHHCICRNNMAIPFEWRCDGEADCSLGEDETSCDQVLVAILERDFDLPGAIASNDDDSEHPLYAFGQQPMFVTSDNLACSERFITEVVGVPGTNVGDANEFCSFGMSTEDTHTCSSACAERLILWAEDCAHVDGMLPPAEVVKLANYLLCCFKADEQGSEYTCPMPAPVNSVGQITSNCDGGQTNIGRLGDGICDTELDCGQFQQDFGDCEVRLSVDMPFTIVGAVTEQILLMVLTDTVGWMTPDDIEVVSVEQTIVGEIDITHPHVNAFRFSSSPAAAMQLKHGFKLWLGLPNTGGITLNEPCDLSSSGECQDAYGRRLQERTSGQGVRIGYTIVAAKDAAASMFTVNNGAADLADAIARAALIGLSPDVLPACLLRSFEPAGDRCGGEVSVADPTLTTTFRLRMSVTEQEFENAADDGTDTSYQALQREFESTYIGSTAQGILQAALQQELANGIYGGMAIPTWASSATITVPVEKDIIFQADVRRPATPVDSDAISDEKLALIAVVGIISLVVVCIAACGCGIVIFSRHTSKVVIMDQDGNIISSFETDGDAENLEGEVLQKMLADHIAKTQLKFRAKQEAEVKAVEMQAEILKEIVVVDDTSGPDPEDELIALIAAPIVDAIQPEQAELDALVSSAAAPIQDLSNQDLIDQESLTDAYKRDVGSVMAKRQVSRASAHKKLEERRAAAAAKRKKELTDAGVDPITADEFAAQVEAAHAEYTGQELEVDAAVDAEEVALLSAKKAEFDVAMATTETDQAKSNLKAAYEAEQLEAKTALAAKRAAQKDALRAKLEEKKATMLAQQKSKVEEVAPQAAAEVAAILDEQIASRGSAEEDTSPAEAVDVAPNLVDAYKRDIDSVMAKRQASRAAAQQKLAERRARAAAQQKQELANTGVDDAIVEEIALERAQIDEEEAAEVLKLEAEADAEESELLAKEKAELMTKAAAADDAQKAALTAEYQEETKKARAELDAKRSAKREALQKKLEAKKNAVREKEKQKLASSAGAEQAVAVLEVQNITRDAGMKAMLASMKGKRELAAQQEAHEQELAALKAAQEQERAEQEKKIADMKRKFEELQKEKMEEMEVDHDEVAHALVDDISTATEEDKAKVAAQQADKKAALQARLEKKKRLMEEKKRRAAELLSETDL